MAHSKNGCIMGKLLHKIKLGNHVSLLVAVKKNRVAKSPLPQTGGFLDFFLKSS